MSRLTAVSFASKAAQSRSRAASVTRMVDHKVENSIRYTAQITGGQEKQAYLRGKQILQTLSNLPDFGQLNQSIAALQTKGMDDFLVVMKTRSACDHFAEMAPIININNIKFLAQVGEPDNFEFGARRVKVIIYDAPLSVSDESIILHLKPFGEAIGNAVYWELYEPPFSHIQSGTRFVYMRNILKEGIPPVMVINKNKIRFRHPDQVKELRERDRMRDERERSVAQGTEEQPNPESETQKTPVRTQRGDEISTENSQLLNGARSRDRQYTEPSGLRRQADPFDDPDHVVNKNDGDVMGATNLDQQWDYSGEYPVRFGETHYEMDGNIPQGHALSDSSYEKITRNRRKSGITRDHASYDRRLPNVRLSETDSNWPTLQQAHSHLTTRVHTENRFDFFSHQFESEGPRHPKSVTDKHMGQKETESKSRQKKKAQRKKKARSSKIGNALDESSSDDDAGNPHPRGTAPISGSPRAPEVVSKTSAGDGSTDAFEGSKTATPPYIFITNDDGSITIEHVESPSPQINPEPEIDQVTSPETTEANIIPPSDTLIPPDMPESRQTLYGSDDEIVRNLMEFPDDDDSEMATDQSSSEEPETGSDVIEPNQLVDGSAEQGPSELSQVLMAAAMEPTGHGNDVIAPNPKHLCDKSNVTSLVAHFNQGNPATSKRKVISPEQKSGTEQNQRKFMKTAPSKNAESDAELF